jgi:DNA polymerase-3 subunit delta'
MNHRNPAQLPWLMDSWMQLQRYLQEDRLPQALLIHGAPKLGKADLAVAFAHKLLCTALQPEPCGDCVGCHLFAAGTHPDFLQVAPEEEGKAIKIDAIRKLINDFALKPHYPGFRVFIIHRAESMSTSAANALLKTLEEPAERNVILLLADQIDRLPATILSRCQKLTVRPPRMDSAKSWLLAQRQDCAADVLLAAANGSPIRALELADTDVAARHQTAFDEFAGIIGRGLDPVRVAERWLGESPEECLDWAISWLADLIRLGVTGDASRTRNPDLITDMRDAGTRIGPRQLLDYWAELLNFRQALTGQINRQLLLEDALIRWSRLRGGSIKALAR